MPQDYADFLEKRVKNEFYTEGSFFLLIKIKITIYFVF
jgi:hypothetical protein